MAALLAMWSTLAHSAVAPNLTAQLGEVADGSLQSAQVLAADPLIAQIERQLALKYPGARVEVLGAVQWLRGGRLPRWSTLSLQGESPRAQLQFEIRGEEGASLGQVGFAVWMPAYQALRRVMPGEKLSADQFVVQQINLAQGPASELKNSLLSSESMLEGLEARQTIIEGSSLTSYAVQRSPDIKRGEAVQILIRSGDLVLTTHGTALEAGYKNSRVKVLSTRTKRELNGSLTADGKIEVNL